MSATIPKSIPKTTLHPPTGRPSWRGAADSETSGELPLIYLGWGHRDFTRDPVALHYDLGTNYYLLLEGRMVVSANGAEQSVRGPTILLFDPECAFSLTQTQSRPASTEILVWVWQGRPGLAELRPPPGGVLTLNLEPRALESLIYLHTRCRNEVSIADAFVPQTLGVLRALLEIEILRASRSSAVAEDVRWKLANTWMMSNLSIHAPVPALCDYLRMSPSTLHRFFQAKADLSPGAWFRRLKTEEARRLIDQEGWQVKAAAFHLGYRHANDLSRILAAVRSPARRIKGKVYAREQTR